MSCCDMFLVLRCFYWDIVTIVNCQILWGRGHDYYYFRNEWLVGEPISWTIDWYAWDFAKWLSQGLNFQRVFEAFLSFTTALFWATFFLSRYNCSCPFGDSFCCLMRYIIPLIVITWIGESWSGALDKFYADDWINLDRSGEEDSQGNPTTPHLHRVDPEGDGWRQLMRRASRRSIARDPIWRPLLGHPKPRPRCPRRPK
jgi:hypothetical protein